MPSGSSFDSGKKAVTLTHHRAVFNAVTKAYITVKNLHPVVASDPDIDSPKQARPLTYEKIEFAVDVENATEAAIKDQPRLQATWLQLAAGDTTVDPALAMRTIRACAKVYENRGLDPGIYFHKIRRGGVGK